MKKSIIISAIVLVPLVCTGLYFFLCNNRPGTVCPQPEHTPEMLRIGALNINWMSFNSDPEMTAGKLLQSAVENELDLILLQEYKESWNFDDKAFRKLFRKEYRHIDMEGECAIISKYPIASHKRVKFDDFSDTFSEIELKLPSGQIIKVLAVHLMTTGINNFTTGDMAKSISGVDVAYTFFGNGDIRKNQGVSLHRRAAAATLPLIIAGDFNCVPFSAPYRMMMDAGLKDSFFEAGRGSGSTYRGMGDLMRIDYIFYSDDFVCIDSRIIDDYISDHKMVVSSFLMASDSIENQTEE